jgi:HTH-type transcriptional regulator/antitoxin HigA
MANKTTLLPEIIPTRFADLCVMHPPRPIIDRIEYDNAVEVVDRLATLPKRSRGQEEYLETLTILIERYDRDHVSESVASDPVTRLRRLITNHEMNASDLGRVLGNRSLGAAILRGDRAISRANAVKLGEFFKLDPAAFFQA